MIHARRWTLAAFWLVILTGCGGGGTHSGKYEIATFEVPAEVLLKMADTESGSAIPEEWESPAIKLSPEHNPFMVEIEFEGRTLGAGRAENLFEVVWFGLNGEPGGPVQLLRFVRDPASEGIQPFQARHVGPPLSFKKEQEINLRLRLEKHALMAPSRLVVHVRSGVSDTYWVDMLLSFRTLWVGLVMMVLWRLWFRVRRH